MNITGRHIIFGLGFLVVGVLIIGLVYSNGNIEIVPDISRYSPKLLSMYNTNLSSNDVLNKLSHMEGIMLQYNQGKEQIQQLSKDIASIKELLALKASNASQQEFKLSQLKHDLSLIKEMVSAEKLKNEGIHVNPDSTEQLKNILSEDKLHHNGKFWSCILSIVKVLFILIQVIFIGTFSRPNFLRLLLAFSKTWKS